MKARADFPDWMGPMLVKELRQGLKARGFVLSFVTLQAILVIVLIYNVLDYQRADRNFSPEALSSIFWMLICAQLIFITPLRALNELAAERKANTLELIFMSGLSAWGITFGKWISLLFQALLFVLAILPYAILRYYFGGVNLTEDLILMGMTLLCCALISAVALAISGLPLFARIAAMVIAFFFLMGMVPSLLFATMGARGRGPGISGLDDVNWWIILVDVVAVSMIALEIGAATVAPLAENHVGRQRAWALVAWLPVPAMIALKVNVDTIGAQLVLFALLATILCWHHLSGVPFPLRSFCRPFAGKRAPLGIAFQPGWPSALIFLSLCVALVVAPIHLHRGFDKDWRWFAAGCIVGGAALLTSTLMWVVVRRRARWPLVEQSIFLVLCAAAVLLASAGVPRHDSMGNFLPMGILPPMAVFSMWQTSAPIWRQWSIVGMCAFAVYALVLLLLSRKYWVHYFVTCRRLAAARRESHP